MRQAGRSLPEYRAIRERHSFFEVANEPELCAEVTLQPVRRHDVDAAVMFADIMTPVVGMGIDVELVEGVGPVVEQPIRTAADVERLRIPGPGGGVRAGARGGPARPLRAPGREGGGRVLRRPVHRRRLPRRGPPEPRAAADEGAHALRARDVGRADGEARGRVRVLRRAKVRAGRRRRPALRLVGRDALSGALPRAGRPVERADPRGRGRADDPLRDRRRAPPRRPRRGGRRRDRARLAAPARRRLGARRRPRRPGQPRPGRARRAVGRRRARGARRARAGRRTSGPHLQPRPRRAPRDRPGRAHAARRARARADGGGASPHDEPGGRPHGVRLARPAGRRARLLRGHPRRAPDPARAARRPRRALPGARDRRLGRPSPLNAITEETRAASRRRSGSASSPGCATGSRGSPRRWRPRSSSGTTRSSASCSRRTGRRSRSRSTSGSSRTPWPGASRPGSCASGAASRVRLAAWRRIRDALGERRPHVVFTATRSRRASSRSGDTYRERCSRRSGSSRTAAGVGDWSFAFQSESPTGEPWLGPDILDHLDALAAAGVTDVLVCPVGFVSDHLEIRWDLDVEAAERARSSASRFARIEMPNADPGADRRARRDRPARARGRGRVERAARRDPGRRRLAANSSSAPARPHTLKELLVARGRTGAQEVWALRTCRSRSRPESPSGSSDATGPGKSTLLRLIAGIIEPTEGRVVTGGRVGSLLELGAGFHPDFTGRENVELNGMLQGLTRARIRERFDEIVAFAELEHAIDRPVRTYSSGMTMRLGFAIAAFLEADVLLLDEVFAVGDESFQRKCFGVIAAFKERGGTILFVSHDASAVERSATARCCFAKAGSRSTGPSTRRSPATGGRSPRTARRWSAPRACPPGPARRASRRVRLVARTASRASRFLAGEPFGLEIKLTGAVEAPSLHLEVRDGSGLLVAEEIVDPRSLGWNGAATVSRSARRARAAAPVRAVRRRPRARRRRRPPPRPAAARHPAARLPRRRGPRASSDSKEPGGATRRMQAR